MENSRLLSLSELAEGKAYKAGTRVVRDDGTYMKMNDGSWEKLGKAKKGQRQAKGTFNFVTHGVHYSKSNE
jgi:hypothetical protein